MIAVSNLAGSAPPSQGLPLLHGAVGIFDELALVACIVLLAVVVVVFYVSQLANAKKKPKDGQKR